ncbi:hypothetical protein [Massilibacteroides sp.]|uniref:hypothetical protein n=1 Tax=Massilibacteroides sp. TaxID=2034766 RepID=UPI002615CB41|nr:hypothetical protein [Massilibacteroides sp.]MDD4514555.1 hypothetical protein [Massilibacteroides sp.]
MRIEELLEKYFEGETSSIEEGEIRRYFASKDIPSHLSAYKPLFAYIDEERAIIPNHPSPIRKNKRIVTYLLSGVAAASLLILGIRSIYTSNKTRYCAENYVMINGRCYTDIHKIRNMALDALREVATPADEYFPDDVSDYSTEKEVLESQLKEFGSLFNVDK